MVDGKEGGMGCSLQGTQPAAGISLAMNCLGVGMTTSSATSPAATTTTSWSIDPAHSLVEFSAKHMMFTTVKGRFTAITGLILDVADDPTRSSVEAEIQTASLSTGDDKRDGHLRSADFLDVETYPTVTFKSTRVDGTRDRFHVTGDLTIRGITRQVTLDAEFQGTGKSPWGQAVAGFAAQTTINRKDFGLNWNVALETGGVLVSDTIKISLELQVINKN
jgi:polyisoprenoid-binding protein YceI